MSQMVYKYPGNEKKPDHIVFKGCVIDYKAVSVDQIEACLADGWVLSPLDAIEKPEAPKLVEEAPKPKRRGRPRKLPEPDVGFTLSTTDLPSL